MLSDTAKDNASVVDSSSSDWKNDMGNFDDPENPGYRAKEDVDGNADADACQRELGKQFHSSEQLQNSSLSKREKQCKTRYFIIKSLNHQNIQLSIKKGIWATQVMNEPILEEAFHNSGKVILIFSVNMSGFFQGYAQMMSSIGWRRDNVWSQGSDGNNPWGRSFRVKWLRVHDLPFQNTLHLRNPLNDYKPVKISRDCQELTEDIGEALCSLLDGETEMDAKTVSGEFSRYDPCMRTLGVDPCSSLQIEDFMTPVRMDPAMYTSFLYHQNTVAKRLYLGNERVNGASTVDTEKDQDVSVQFGGWGQPAERSSMASTLTDDDILDMTYEEYLEAHSRCEERAAGSSSDIQKSSSSKAVSDDSQYLCSSRKKPRLRSPRR